MIRTMASSQGSSRNNNPPPERFDSPGSNSLSRIQQAPHWNQVWEQNRAESNMPGVWRLDAPLPIALRDQPGDWAGLQIQSLPVFGMRVARSHLFRRKAGPKTLGHGNLLVAGCDHSDALARVLYHQQQTRFRARRHPGIWF